MARTAPTPRSVGYEHLLVKYDIKTFPYWVESSISSGRKTVQNSSGRTIETYPKKYWPGEKDFDHLNFALNREGIHLELLRKLLPLLCLDELISFISDRPTGANSRRIWCLYEKLTGTKLDIPDLDSKVKYLPLLDPKKYYVGPGHVSSRHRVKVNLLGCLQFSPFVRKTQELQEWEDKELEKSCEESINVIPPELFDRIRDYLYTKETKSSFAIERLKPDAKRAGTFARLLSEASNEDYLSKRALVELQTRIVDPQYALSDYRHNGGEQVYVGESTSLTDQVVHFIAPKQDDIESLMGEFLEAAQIIISSKIHPVIAATLISYVFVFLHPFPDGNGRIHRFLTHYVLSKRKFAPEGIVFPISAIMLNRSRDYNDSLELFSRDLMALIDYELDERDRMTVLNETDNYYRHIDLTSICGKLFSFVEETIVKEIPAEVDFLKNYDKARLNIREVLDMPNRIADLFIRLCLQNNGSLSKTKRSLPEFSSLDDAVIAAMEDVIKDSFNLIVED